MFKVIAIIALAAACVADDGYKPAYKPEYEEASYDDPPKYNFDWAVKDDYTYNNFAQSESRDGYNTDGSYSVALPDGRTQTVKYYVNGDSGYVAEVTYSGEAKYDDAYKKSSYAPAPYKAEASYQKPAYAPAPYKAEASYQKPAYAPAPYQPEQSYNKPAYKAEPAYAPEPYKPEPSYRKPAAYKPAYAPLPYKA